MNIKRLIIIEPTGKNYSAYSPDFPGCVATGSTKAEVRKRMKEAIEMHIEGLKEDGGTIPEAQSEADFVSLAVD